MRYTSLILVLVCVVVFVLQGLFSGFTDSFLLDSSKVWQEPWRLITSVFLHGSLEHLVFNMFALALFGFILENIIGSKKLLLLFFAGGFFASFLSAFFYSSSLGASGAICALIGTLAVLRYRMVVWFFGIPMPMFVAAIFWGMTDILGVFYPSNIGNIAHIAGLGFGLVFSYFVKEYIQRSRKSREKYLSNKDLEDWEDRYMQ